MCWDAIYSSGYGRCTHQFGKDRAKIDCHRSNCALSSNHTRAPHNCGTTCAQQTSGPMRVVDDRSARCDKCALGK
uniref:Uncharacterized protein n=1 Tax=Mycena chlorophos TaxID=658473 RepID=A0ABQ0L3E1_MYCCL|nr:predicted protein [Mycena chlorophos]